jgi:cobyrinic acid a,c-diamide synthase
MENSRTKIVKIQKISHPRILISALRGSSAKTIVSLGIIVAFIRRGLKIFPYKKGPDYIDAAWLSQAAGEVCDHLDLYIMGVEGVQEVFYRRINPETISIIEGNRGLFDGVDIQGTYSTAMIARLFEIPVVLIVDCTKITNTIAPLIAGCQAFDPKVQFGGIILNRVAGKRHGDILRKSVEYHTGLSVLGELPNLDLKMPERHLGLTPVGETGDISEKLELLGNLSERYLDLDKLLKIAKSASSLSLSLSLKTQVRKPVKVTTSKVRVGVIKDNVFQFYYPENLITLSRKPVKVTTIKVRVGIIKDNAFQFYYPENLIALKQEGAEIIEFDSMRDKSIKPVDILYIAGGFPEIYADKISKNKSFRDSVRIFAEKGLPIYGECGAVIFLGRRVLYNGQKYNMCGVFSLDFELTKKPAGHGYTEVEVDKDNPFFPVGTKLKGHEFHYSIPTNWNLSTYDTAFCVKKGFGFDGSRDGVHKKNVFATYTHLHATGTKSWAKWLVKKARQTGFSKPM